MPSSTVTFGGHICNRLPLYAGINIGHRLLFGRTAFICVYDMRHNLLGNSVFTSCEDVTWLVTSLDLYMQFTTCKCADEGPFIFSTYMTYKKHGTKLPVR